MRSLYDTPPPNAPPETAAGAVRRRRSRKVRLTSRRFYRSSRGASGGIRPSRRRWKRIVFWAICVGLVGVLAAALWMARRQPSAPTPAMADPLRMDGLKGIR